MSFGGENSKIVDYAVEPSVLGNNASSSSSNAVRESDDDASELLIDNNNNNNAHANVVGLRKSASNTTV